MGLTAWLSAGQGTDWGAAEDDADESSAWALAVARADCCFWRCWLRS